MSRSRHVRGPRARFGARYRRELALFEARRKERRDADRARRDLDAWTTVDDPRDPIVLVLDEEEWAAFSAEIVSPRKPNATLRAIFKIGSYVRRFRSARRYTALYAHRWLLQPRDPVVLMWWPSWIATPWTTDIGQHEAPADDDRRVQHPNGGE